MAAAKCESFFAMPEKKKKQPKQTQPRQPGREYEMTPRPKAEDEKHRGSGKLQDKVALITGGDSGIGRAVALCYAKEGADILFTHLKEEKEDAEETVRLVESVGRRAIAIPGDIRKRDFCQKLVDQTFSRLGRLDILVNNAAYQRTYAKLEDIPEEEFDATFRTNVYGTFFLTQATLPRMQPGGAIIITCSIETFTPEPSLAPYAATKAALASLTKSFAKLAMERGVRVNGVAPGPVWTPLIPSTMEPDHVKVFGQNTTFKRPAMPVEQAAIFVFLATDDASYVNGEIYGATGGRMPI
jgi:NAD(P)-dependent dehydrogenase (short-subunit alcohol dehydrogenase family)